MHFRLISSDEGRPVEPVVAAEGTDWSCLVLHRYRHTACRSEAVPAHCNLLCVRLDGQAHLEERGDNGRTERRWTDAGHFSLTPAGFPLQRRVRGKSDVLVIGVDPGLIAEVVGTVFDHDPSRVQLSPRLAHREGHIEALGRLLLTEAEMTDVGTRLAVESLTSALALHLVRHHSSLSKPTSQGPSLLPPSRFRRALDLMHDRLSSDVSISDLAGISGLSSPQFTLAFRKSFGTSPYQYFLALRIEKAKQLLEEGQLSIIQVALECGYEQPNHFASMFRKQVGISPGDWRRLRRS